MCRSTVVRNLGWRYCLHYPHKSSSISVFHKGTNICVYYMNMTIVISSCYDRLSLLEAGSPKPTARVLHLDESASSSLERISRSGCTITRVFCRCCLAVGTGDQQPNAPGPSLLPFAHCLWRRSGRSWSYLAPGLVGLLWREGRDVQHPWVAAAHTHARLRRLSLLWAEASSCQATRTRSSNC